MFFKSLEKLAITAIGTAGAMGTITPNTHDIYADYLVSQSFNVSLPTAEIIKEWRDGANAASVAVPGRSEGLVITFKLEQLRNDLFVLLMGGATADTLPTKYSHAITRQALYKSLAMTAHQVGSTQFYMEIPYGLMTAGLMGNPTQDAQGKVELDCKFEALTPINASGVLLEPWDSWDLLDKA